MFNFMLEDSQMSLQQDGEKRDRLLWVLTCPCLIKYVAFWSYVKRILAFSFEAVFPLCVPCSTGLMLLCIITSAIYFAFLRE